MTLEGERLMDEIDREKFSGVGAPSFGIEPPDGWHWILNEEKPSDIDYSKEGIELNVTLHDSPRMIKKKLKKAIKEHEANEASAPCVLIKG